MATVRPFVAVLDDEASIRRALERLLRSAGFEVHAFASGPDFLSSLKDNLPGCLVLDLHMREMSGFGVLAALEARSLPMPVIVITAQDDETVEPRALKAGARRFMRKPIQDDDLLHAVAAAFRSGAPAAAPYSARRPSRSAVRSNPTLT